MHVDVFIDTNILFCAHDADAGPKHETAAALVDRIWTQRQ